MNAQKASGLKIAENFTFPIDVVTSTLIVYGGKGMGKTNFGAVLVEEMAKAGLRWSLIDPMGVAWGLRHSRDGKGPGVSCLILGGPHGDIPIEPTGGAVVADLVVDEHVSVIIDISRKPNGEAWGVGEKIRFVTEYGQRLLQRQAGLINGKRREPIFQMIDEAARFIPQTIRSNEPQIAMCVSVWAQIVEEGRNFGIGVGLLTQRSARLNKDVAELADAMLAFRTVGPNSVDAVMDWLGEHISKQRAHAMVESLRSLPRGSALLVSPGWLEHEDVIAVRQRETFDSSATPKPGEQTARVTGAAAKPDLDKYADRMRETIERAKENDPKELKRKIVELERELAKKPNAQPAQVETVEVKVAVLDRELVEDLQGCAITLEAVAKTVVGAQDNLRKSIEAAVALCQQKPTQNIPKLFQPTRPDAQSSRPTPIVSHRNGDSSLPKGERATLIAIAQYESIERDTITILTGYKRSTRDAYIQRLRERGFIEQNGNAIIPTQAGVDALGSDYEPLPTGEALQNYWIGRLPEGERRVLEILLSANGKSIPRETIDESTGYKRSTRDAYLQRLFARRLVDSVGRGEVCAAEVLFA